MQSERSQSQNTNTTCHIDSEVSKVVKFTSRKFSGGCKGQMGGGGGLPVQWV